MYVGALLKWCDLRSISDKGTCQFGPSRTFFWLLIPLWYKSEWLRNCLVISVSGALTWGCSKDIKARHSSAVGLALIRAFCRRVFRIPREWNEWVIWECVAVWGFCIKNLMIELLSCCKCWELKVLGERHWSSPKQSECVGMEFVWELICNYEDVIFLFGGVLFPLL